MFGADPRRDAMITQRLLAEYGELKRERDEIDRQAGELRLLILERHAAGAPVEPGPMSYRVMPRPRHPFDHTSLEAALGADGFARLCERLPVVEQQCLYVSGRAPSGPIPGRPGGRAGKSS